ncbi:hypothetical protein ACHAW6_009570 [Cyclotella cf. meneghiniana]
MILMILWTRYFLKSQGYQVPGQQKCNSLEQSDKLSSTKSTKHMNICYFFVMDKIKEGELSADWRPLLLW